MKRFLIKYRRKTATAEAWHEDIARFISALDNDPDLKDTISYRCMRIGDGDEYFHIATPANEEAVKTLQSRDFFKRYNEQTRAVAGGEVQVSPIEIVGETKHKA